MTRRMLEVFRGQALQPPPIWLMRQAGRYLPEYREVRAKAGSFLDLCYSPSMAAEVTLQPIRRYGFDASILFADILVVPDALGQGVSFVEGEGPRLDAIRDGKGLARLEPARAEAKFGIIAQTVSRLRQDLPKETTLIGFCGSPWTVATYMVAGEGTKEQEPARMLAYRDPTLFARLIDLIVEASTRYLSLQVSAGADMLQLFDSWAGSLADSEFDRWVIEPTKRLVANVRAQHPGVPIIGFPRGAGLHARRYVELTGVDGVSCDTAMPMDRIRRELSGKTAVQGNLDPLLLVAGGEPMRARAREIVTQLSANPFVFNLGHGIVPQTPPEHVADLVRTVRGG